MCTLSIGRGLDVLDRARLHDRQQPLGVAAGAGADGDAAAAGRGGDQPGGRALGDGDAATAAAAAASPPPAAAAAGARPWRPGCARAGGRGSWTPPRTAPRSARSARPRRPARPRPPARPPPWPPRPSARASSARLRRCSGISVMSITSCVGWGGEEGVRKGRTTSSHHSGPEMPPSLRTRQKWMAMKMTMTNGSNSTCSTYQRSSVSVPISSPPSSTKRTWSPNTGV